MVKKCYFYVGEFQAKENMNNFTSISFIHAVLRIGNDFPSTRKAYVPACIYIASIKKSFHNRLKENYSLK